MIDFERRLAKIAAIEFYLPENILSNNDLEKLFDSWSAERIYKSTGIINRRFANKDECASDMGVQAAKRLIENNQLDPKKIEMLIFCTQTPDYIVPSTACIIQDRLGLSNSCAAFDYTLGCSGYIYGLAIANAFIVSNMVKNVLLITGDTVTKLFNPGDKSVRMVMGDAASATYLDTENGFAEISGDFVLGTDGSGYQDLIVPAGAFRIPKTVETAIEKECEEGNIRSQEDFYMNGTKVFVFTIKRVPETINILMEKNRITLDNIDWFVLHQANKFIIDYLVKKTGIPKNKVLFCLEEYGNTSASSIPIVLKDAQSKNIFKKDDLILTIGFGIGYSWGANLLRWTDNT